MVAWGTFGHCVQIANGLEPFQFEATLSTGGTEDWVRFPELTSLLFLLFLRLS